MTIQFCDQSSFFYLVLAVATEMAHVEALLLLLIITYTRSAIGCPDKCSCNSTTLTVICSDFALTWNQILNNIPTTTKMLQFKNGRILERVVIDSPFRPRIPQVQSLPKMTSLHITSSELTMNEKTFQPFREIEELHLVYNSLEQLNNTKMFRDLTNMRLLNLSHNKLKELDDELFENMHNLKVLDLSFNQLKSLPHNIFDVLEDLQSLHINDNELEYIHPDSVGNLTSLHTLHLDSNALETLHQAVLPQNMSSVARLKLQV